MPSPADATTVPDLVARAAARWPDRIAVTVDPPNESLTYRELDDLSSGFATELVRRGVEPGDRVAVVARNGLAYPIAWLGILKARAVLVPINRYAMDDDATHILDHCGARIALAQPEYVPLLERVQPRVPALSTVLTLNDDPGAESSQTVLAVWEALGRAGVEPPIDRHWPEDLANIQYTSGTTGRPKGCMLSNRYWVELARAITNYPQVLTHDDVLLSAQPFSYMDPQWTLAAGLLLGARVVVLDRFHPSTFWSKVAEHQATFFYCLGAMPTLMSRMPPGDADKRHAVRFICCSAIPTSLHAELEARYGVPWFELYGSTETGADAAMAPLWQPGMLGSGCIGRPYPHREIRIVDDDDRPRARGALGHIVIRGHSMMDGYFNDPDATAVAFRNGWFHTGDVGWQDDEGLLHFAGRTKDIIRRSGENVSAVEVEDVIASHPGVELAACVPVPDDLRGEEIKAFVRARPGQPAVDVSELVAHCSERLAYYKVPRFWEQRPDLPMTESGKIAKGALAALPLHGSHPVYDNATGSWLGTDAAGSLRSVAGDPFTSDCC